MKDSRVTALEDGEDIADMSRMRYGGFETFAEPLGRRLVGEVLADRREHLVRGDLRAAGVQVDAVRLAHDLAPAVDLHGVAIAPARREELLHVEHAHLGS